MVNKDYQLPHFLVYKGLRGKLVKLIIDWYGKTFMTVKWNNFLSRTVPVKSGICQGTILSRSI